MYVNCTKPTDYFSGALKRITFSPDARQTNIPISYCSSSTSIMYKNFWNYSLEYFKVHSARARATYWCTHVNMCVGERWIKNQSISETFIQILEIKPYYNISIGNTNALRVNTEHIHFPVTFSKTLSKKQQDISRMWIWFHQRDLLYYT